MRRPWKDSRFEEDAGVGRMYDSQGQGGKPESLPVTLRARLEPGGMHFLCELL